MDKIVRSQCKPAKHDTRDPQTGRFMQKAAAGRGGFNLLSSCAVFASNPGLQSVPTRKLPGDTQHSSMETLRPAASRMANSHNSRWGRSAPPMPTGTETGRRSFGMCLSIKAKTKKVSSLQVRRTVSMGVLRAESGFRTKHVSDSSTSKMGVPTSRPDQRATKFMAEVHGCREGGAGTCKDPRV